ncbi:MAG: class I SAM-dependent methyltransferase [Burkholderiales bacterium]|nr:class I SAM-dependent methyltransferase [Phycisphaerae bacterium]
MNPVWNQISGSHLSQDQLSKIDQYLDLLIEKNKVLNLTRISDRADAEIKHVADALTLLRFLPLPPGEGRGEGTGGTGSAGTLTQTLSRMERGPIQLADVGAGGGIIGVIIAIARPDISVTLIDSTKKKLDAVMAMVGEIGVTNIRAIHSRMEDLDEKYDIVTARAVAELDKLLGWCDKLMRRSSILLAMKGPKAAEEIANVTAWNKKRWNLSSNAVDHPALAGHVIVVGKHY